MTHAPTTRFRGRTLPEPAIPVGYAALIGGYDLRVPLPAQGAAIALRHRPLSNAQWQLFGPRRMPEDSLYGHLEFALKREGVDLLVLALLFERVDAEEVAAIVRAAPTGSYARRIWFLYEWLTGRRLEIGETPRVSAVPVVDTALQYALPDGELSPRHRVLNNLPGTPAFCPMVWRTATLEGARGAELPRRVRALLEKLVPHDSLSRLGESRASFDLGGEAAAGGAAARWGRALGEAAAPPLSVEELSGLQAAFRRGSAGKEAGLREVDGYVGMRDRRTGRAAPEHIGARPADLVDLLEGVIQYADRSAAGGLDPVLAATSVAFGFAYLRPFENGNGRLARWLLQRQFQLGGVCPPGVALPISAILLARREESRRVLASWSDPLVEQCIDWDGGPDGTIEVRNDTVPYYRYFDATEHAEFIYRCLRDAVEREIPAELAYAAGFTRFAAGVEERLDLSQSTIRELYSALRSSGGRFTDDQRSSAATGLSPAERRNLEGIFMLATRRGT